MTRLPEDIFNDALELPESERDAFIDAACQGCSKKREDVGELLALAVEHPELVDGNLLMSQPEQIGGYRIIRRCGAGGMGTVYQAHDSKLNRSVAIKILSMPPSLFGRSSREIEVARSRLQREAVILASVNHPNIATIHALEYDDDVPFLVLEYVVGETLGAKLKSGTLTSEQKIRICRDVAVGLATAHGNGIVHRDLKPANVMIDNDGQVKVLDFGIAKFLEISEQMGEIRSGTGSEAREKTTSLGTTGFMSPEQGRGEAIDFRADIWSFGVLLSKCFGVVAGRKAGGTGSSLLTKNRHLPIPTLIRSCLQEKPIDRPESMQVLVKSLDRLLMFQTVLSWLGNSGLALAGVLVLAGMIIIGTNWLKSEPQPVAAVPMGRSVEVLYTNNKTKIMVPPESESEPIVNALIVPLTTNSAQSLITGSTSPDETDVSKLFVWDADGKYLQAIVPTDDWLYSPTGSDDTNIYSRKQFALTFPPSINNRDLSLIECSHYFPSVFRVFEVSKDGIRDRYKLYHAGHINEMKHTPGLGGATGFWWLTGRIRDGDGLREGVGGAEHNTHFIACFADSARAIEYFPGWIAPDDSFIENQSLPVRAAKPFLYFVMQGVTAADGRIYHTVSKQMKVDSAYSDSLDTAWVLLSNTLRLDLKRIDEKSLHIDASIAGDIQLIVSNRAKPVGLSGGERVARFIADSMLVLVDAREGIEITGNFKDLRHKFRK